MVKQEEHQILIGFKQIDEQFKRFGVFLEYFFFIIIIIISRFLPLMRHTQHDMVK